MANKEASFAVRLIDRVTGPARKVAGALARIRKVARAANKPGGMGRGAGNRQAGFFPAMSRGPSKRQAAMGRRVDRATKSVNGLITSLAGAAVKAGLLATGLAAVGAAFVVKGIAEATMFAERMRFAFTTLTGSASKGEEAFQRSIALARELGLNVQDTANQYAGLLAAQFSVGKAETLIKLTADLRSVGKTAEETKSAIRAITQIKAKGRLQAEELVGQLSEAGVGADLVYAQLEKQLGKTRKQVIALITAGGVDADAGINAIEAAILKMANIKKAGEAGKKFANATLAGMWERLKNAPSSLFLRIAEAGKNALPKLKGLVEQVTKAIDSIDPHAVAMAFERVIDLARIGITLGLEFASGFAAGFGEITAALQPGSVADASKTFRELGRNVAKLAVFAIDAGKALGTFFNWINSDGGKAALWIAGIGWAAFQAAGFVGGLGIAFGATAGTMGTLGLGFSLIGKGFGWVASLAWAGAQALWGFVAAASAAIAPFILPALALAGAFTAAYLAMKKLLDLTGGTNAIGDFFAKLAPSEVNSGAGRGMGKPIAAEAPGYPYSTSRPATTTSALVKSDQLAPSPALAKFGTQVGSVTLNVGAPPASMANRPREWGQKLAEGFKSGLAGEMPAGAAAGG